MSPEHSISQPCLRTTQHELWAVPVMQPDSRRERHSPLPSAMQVPNGALYLELGPEPTGKRQDRQAANDGEEQNCENPLTSVLHTLPILPSLM